MFLVTLQLLPPLTRANQGPGPPHGTGQGSGRPSQSEPGRSSPRTARHPSATSSSSFLVSTRVLIRPLGPPLSRHSRRSPWPTRPWSKDSPCRSTLGTDPVLPSQSQPYRAAATTRALRPLRGRHTSPRLRTPPPWSRRSLRW